MTIQIENLKEFVRCYQDGEMPRRDLISWLAECLDQVLSHRVSSFEEAFGLRNCHGGVPWWLENAMHERNKALQKLAARHFAHLSRSKQAQKIETLSKRYMASAWRFDRNGIDMPPHYRDHPQEWLWRAFKAGASMPLTQRQLRNIL